MSFQLHPDARNEFREAVLFYGRAAESFVNAVEAAIAAIILKPDRFREFEPGVRTCRADKLGKPVLHIYHTRKERILNQDSLRLEIQALTDFLCSKKIEILNVAGPRESKEPGVYEWTLTILRFSLNRAVSGTGSIETAI